MKKKAPDIQVGDIFEDLKVIQEIGRRPNKYGTMYYLVECTVCHRQKELSRSCLIGHIGTCHSACAHGLRNTVPRFHALWQGIRSRTTNPNNQNSKWYIDKGINSDAFRYFIDFYDMMYASYVQACKLYGEKAVSIDRIDPNGHYCFENCKWIRINDQQSNTTKQRWFKATSPDGIEYIANNQSKFAREHNLSDKQVNACLSGRFQTHFGWQFKYIKCNDYPETADELKQVAIGVRPTDTVGR